MKTGIGTARGICTCVVPTRCGCKCYSFQFSTNSQCNSPPAEMRLYRDSDRYNKTTVTIEVKNISVIDAGKRFGDDETTTDIDVNPVAGKVTLMYLLIIILHIIQTFL